MSEDRKSLNGDLKMRLGTPQMAPCGIRYWVAPRIEQKVIYRRGGSIVDVHAYHKQRRL
jgi:hypothetical protein